MFISKQVKIGRIFRRTLAEHSAKLSAILVRTYPFWYTFANLLALFSLDLFSLTALICLTRRAMELGFRNFPPLDLRQLSVRGHDVQGDLRHPDGENSLSDILRRPILDVNFSRKSSTTFRTVYVDRSTRRCDLWGKEFGY